MRADWNASAMRHERTQNIGRNFIGQYQHIESMNDEPDDSYYDEVQEEREQRFNDYCAARDWEQGIPDWRDDD